MEYEWENVEDVEALPIAVFPRTTRADRVRAAAAFTSPDDAHELRAPRE